MDPSEFVTAWQADAEDDLTRFPREAIAAYHLPAQSIDFLSEAGLPSSAAPFLAFEIPKSGHVQTVTDLWQLDDSFARWITIGSNGSGDPIAIDAMSTHGAIYYLNHDNDFAPRLMASSVQQLAQLLLSFRNLVTQTRDLGGSDAFLDGEIPPALRASFLNDLARIDPAAAKDSMWLDELSTGDRD
jgi:hypothetical protein